MYVGPGNTTRPETRAGEGTRGLGRLRWWAAQCRALTLVQAASMVLAAGAQAQGNSCDEFKAVLAARIESSGVRGYSLEVAPPGTRVPADAKVIGTCESGTRKILYRRWGATRAASGSASAAEPAMASRASAVAAEPSRRVPGASAARPLRPVPASAPNPAPLAVSPPAQAALVAPTPIRAPERPLTAVAGEAEAGRTVDRAATPPAPASTDTAGGVPAPLPQQASDFIAANWQWLGALLLLAVAGGFWLWRAYFSAYDKAGLPRGPRL